MLVPAAIGNQLTSRNARDVKAKLIVDLNRLARDLIDDTATGGMRIDRE